MRTKLTITIIVALGLLWLALAQGACLGATYYLDAVNGNDSNLGTSAQPWKTLERALADNGGSPTVAFGDTVKLRDGNYDYTYISYSSPSASSWDDKITYTADDGHDPIIRRLYIVSRRFYIEFNNIKIRPNADETGIRVQSAKNLRFINLDYEGVWNTNFSDMEEKDSSGYNALSGGIYISGGTADNLMDDITIEGCEISKVTRGITIGGYIGDQNGSWIIRDNNIHTTSNSQIAVTPVNTGTSGYVLIDGNYLHNYYSFYTGFDMSHASGVAIRVNNIAVQNNIIHATGSTAGIGLYRHGGVPGEGFSNVLIQNNLIYDNFSQFAVRLWEISDTGSVIFRNNTVIGWHVESASGTTYYYTVLHIRPYGWYTDDGLPPAHCSGLEIYNNIVVGRVYFDNDQGDLVGLDEYSEDYNYFYSAYDDGAYLTSHDNTTILTNSDYDDTFESGFFVNPDYSPAMHRINLNDGYRLCKGSPAIDSADPTQAPATDILGNPRDDGAPDAGCYEYGASTFLYGDVSGDGNISAYDAALAAMHAVGLITLTDEQATAADVTNNGTVSASDAAWIARRAVDADVVFPVEE